MTCHGWTRKLSHKVQGTIAADEVAKLRRHLCLTALTCLSTYDVDLSPHITSLLQSPLDVSNLVECSITLHDNMPVNVTKIDPDLQRHLARNRRLLQTTESRLATLIEANRTGLDDAILAVWPTYRPGVGVWQRLPDPNSRWVTSTTSQVMGSRSQKVHLNLLDGEMLVDGKPIGRLPREITCHPTYQRVFGEVGGYFSVLIRSCSMVDAFVADFGCDTCGYGWHGLCYPRSGFGLPCMYYIHSAELNGV